MSTSPCTSPVESVAPCVWRVTTDSPRAGSHAAAAYLLEAREGVVMVDAGWDTTAARAAVDATLAAIGLEVDAVRGVLLTHLHPDHLGLADEIRRHSGAWVALHAEDARQLRLRGADRDAELARWRTWLRRSGAPRADVESLVAGTREIQALFEAPAPDVEFEDGWRAPVAGWDLVALHTPGHSPGHVCFHAPRRRLLFSGDHVLPGLTPNISSAPLLAPSPLDDYLRALQRVAGLPVERVLPGHGAPFGDLAGRVREITDHHDVRLMLVAELLAPGAATAWELATAYPWRGPWAAMEPLAQRSALGEITAHLVVLEGRGQATRHGCRPERWTATR